MSTLRLTRGDTGNFRFTVTDVDGLAVNLTGATATFTVKQYITDDVALIEKTEADGLTIVVPETGGLIDLELEPADSDGMEPGHYRFDLEVRLGSYVYTVDDGMLVLIGDVTRDGGS